MFCGRQLIITLWTLTSFLSTLNSDQGSYREASRGKGVTWETKRAGRTPELMGWVGNFSPLFQQQCNWSWASPSSLYCTPWILKWFPKAPPAQRWWMGGTCTHMHRCALTCTHSALEGVGKEANHSWPEPQLQQLTGEVLGQVRSARHLPCTGLEGAQGWRERRALTKRKAWECTKRAGYWVKGHGSPRTHPCFTAGCFFH